MFAFILRLHRFFLITLFFSGHAVAQVCPEADYVIFSRAAYESFIDDLDQCDVVSGSVYISGSDLAPELDFPLRRIEGTLQVRNTSSVIRLRSFDMEFVREFHIEGNATLDRIDFLALSDPPHEIFVESNSELSKIRLTSTAVAFPPRDVTINNQSDWIFGRNDFCQASTGTNSYEAMPIQVDFPGLSIHLQKGIVIRANTCLGKYGVSFEGLSSVGDITVLDNGGARPSTESSSDGGPLRRTPSLGLVNWHAEDAGYTLGGGFLTLEEANQIVIENNENLRTISFPALKTLSSLVVKGAAMELINIEWLESIDQLDLVLGGAGVGRDVTSALGWGFNRLKHIEELSFGLQGEADLSSLFLLNLFNVGLGAGPISFYLNGSNLSLEGITSIQSELKSLLLYDGSISDTDSLLDVNEVQEGLYISGLNFDDLSSLGGLNNIGSDLSIRNSVGLRLDGLEDIEQIGGDLVVEQNIFTNCDALLPLVGWGSQGARVAGGISISGNGPANCNDADLSVLKEEAAPSAISTAPSELSRGGATFKFLPAESSPLFPVVRYEAACRTRILESAEESLVLPANIDTLKTLSFQQAGVVEGVRVGVRFSEVDRGRFRLSLRPPNQPFLKLYDGESSGSGAWEVEFNSNEGNALTSLVGSPASGDWEFEFSPAMVNANLLSYYIDLNSLFTAELNTPNGPDDLVLEEGFIVMAMTGLPPGQVYQCAITASNEFGVSTQAGVQAVTPPEITDTPVISSMTEVSGGLQIDFTVPDYDGNEWFGDIWYVATCETETATYQSEPTSGSPIFLPEAPLDENASCFVSIDNIYEIVSGPSYVAESENLQGLPIWLLYEATRGER